MKILKVAPISRGIFKDELLYFSSKPVTAGSIVGVPVRNKTIDALVIEERETTSLKSQLKSSSFALKKIDSVKSAGFFLPEFIKTCQQSSKYFASGIGAVIDGFVPKIILDNLSKIKISTQKTRKSRGLFSAKVLQCPDDERVSNYRSLIRESFAKKESVFFCLPSTSDVEKKSPLLSKGLEKSSFVIHNDLTKNEIIKIWKKVASAKEPVLIISTPLFLCLPKHDLGLIVLEQESKFRKMLTRPYVNPKFFARSLAENLGLNFVMGDSVLSVETMAGYCQKEFADLAPIRQRILPKAKQLLIDLSLSPKILFSEELLGLLKEGKQTLLVLSRKGVSTLTICRDCGTTIFCKNCSAPLVLHQKNNQPMYICHKCHDTSTTKRYCPKCNSWHLVAYGIGTEKMLSELQELLPGKKILKLDSDTAKTKRQKEKIIEKFYDDPKAILVSTEMAFWNLDKPIDHVCVVSIDNIFTIPDFNNNERVFRLLLGLRGLAKNNFLVQTRYPKFPAIEYALQGNILEFYRHEEKMRRQYDYPPFSLLIKITRQGKKSAVEAEMRKIKELLGDYRPVVIPAFINKIKNAYRVHAIIKVPKEDWPDKTLVGILKSLGPYFTVDVEPTNLL